MTLKYATVSEVWGTNNTIPYSNDESGSMPTFPYREVRQESLDNCEEINTRDEVENFRGPRGPRRYRRRYNRSSRHLGYSGYPRHLMSASEISCNDCISHAGRCGLCFGVLKDKMIKKVFGDKSNMIGMIIIILLLILIFRGK